MPYNEELDMRISEIVQKWKNVDSKKMFGGVGYMFNGNMVCGVHKEYLILRIGEEEASKLSGLPYVKPFDITGRPMKGWLMVKKEGYQTDDQLNQWINKAREFVQELPPK